MDRIQTGITSLDTILEGGFPRASIIMIAGGPGTGKTMLTHEMVYHIANDRNKVLYLTTVSEPMHKVIRHVQEFSFFDETKVGSSIMYEDVGHMLQKSGVEEVMAYMGQLVQREGPTIVVIDSFKALSDLASDIATFRRALYKLAGELTAAGCTTFLLGEYEAGHVSTLAEFAVADGIVEMSNERRGIRSYRYLRVVKLRGSSYHDGQHAIRLTSRGIEVFPRFRTPHTPEPYKPSRDRVSTGVATLDAKLGGGLLRGSATLVVGPTGAGKSLLALSFATAAVQRGEQVAFVSFQEDPNQMTRIAGNFGWDLDAGVESGRLSLLYVSPVELDMDEHIIKIARTIAASDAKCVVIDSLTDLEGAAYDVDRFTSYMFSLIQYTKDRALTVLMTLEASRDFAEAGLTTSDVSRIADNVVLLGSRRDDNKVHRELRIIKTRGSEHDHDIHPLHITNRGMDIGG